MQESGPAGNAKCPIINYHLTMSDPLKPLFDGALPVVERLARQAAAAATLGDKVRRMLPEPLRPHVVSANRRGDDLVVIVDSAAWSARVRYAGPGLREQLAAAGEPVAGKVRVRVGRGERIADSG
jgi:hypothetical protein